MKRKNAGGLLSKDDKEFLRKYKYILDKEPAKKDGEAAKDGKGKPGKGKGKAKAAAKGKTGKLGGGGASNNRSDRLNSEEPLVMNDSDNDINDIALSSEEQDDSDEDDDSDGEE